MEIHKVKYGIFINQQSYARKIFNRFNMINSNPVSTPLEKGQINEGNSKNLDVKISYREMVGSLLYLAMLTRPNIAFAVSLISQVMDKSENSTGKL